jgi:hypothetical protein
VTTSYTALLPLSGDTALVSYDRLSNGWTGPTAGGVYGASDVVYTMTVRVQPGTH